MAILKVEAKVRDKSSLVLILPSTFFGEISKNNASVWYAIAKAAKVLPVPGGPWNKTLATLLPKLDLTKGSPKGNMQYSLSNCLV